MPFVEDATAGSNLPPMHPFCRSTTLPVLPDEEELDRQIKETGDEIGADVSFDEWQKNLVETEDGKLIYRVDKAAESGIILLPDYKNAVIPIEKFTKYALDPKREPNKAEAFSRALGYTKENADKLINRIHEALPFYSAQEKGDNGYGMTYQVIMQIEGENGKEAKVLTAWIKDKNNGETRLISAYVDD